MPGTDLVAGAKPLDRHVTGDDVTTQEPTPPEHIGAYRIESLLGRGGMGEVYLAYDERLHRREARAAARLSHPAIRTRLHCRRR